MLILQSAVMHDICPSITTDISLSTMEPQCLWQEETPQLLMIQAAVALGQEPQVQIHTQSASDPQHSGFLPLLQQRTQGSQPPG